MNRPADITGMPLFIWVRAFIVALIFLVILCFIVISRDKRLAVLELKSEQAEEFTNTDGSRLDAYFLGSSLTKDALMRNNTLDSVIEKRKEKFRYKAVVGDRYCLRDLNSQIADIRKLRPRVLFIESNIACIDYQGNGFSKFRIWLSNVPLYIIMRVNMIFKLFDKPAPHSNFRQNVQRPDFGFLNAGIVNIPNVIIKIRKINDFPLWNEFYKQTAGLDIKIYLLEIPRSLEAEQYIPVKIKQQYNALVREYHDNYNIGYLDFPFSLSRNRYFQDRAHFNEAGSFFYCTWLIKRLSHGKL